MFDDDTYDEYGVNTRSSFNTPPKEKAVKVSDLVNANLHTVWEQLNAVLYDLTEGDPADAVSAVEDCIKRLESMGVSK